MALRKYRLPDNKLKFKHLFVKEDENPSILLLRIDENPLNCFEVILADMSISLDSFRGFTLPDYRLLRHNVFKKEQYPLYDWTNVNRIANNSTGYFAIDVKDTYIKIYHVGHFVVTIKDVGTQALQSEAIEISAKELTGFEINYGKVTWYKQNNESFYDKWRMFSPYVKLPV